MSSVAVTIQGLFEFGQSPSKIRRHQIIRADLVSTRFSSLKETDSALTKVSSTPSRKVRTLKLIKNTREKSRRNS